MTANLNERDRRREREREKAARVAMPCQLISQLNDAMVLPLQVIITISCLADMWKSL